MNPELRAIASSYPAIEPVPAGVKRPFWSVMIPVYNCAHFLRATLASVLPQFGPEEAVQIEVVDDCSTRDDPAAVVAECGEGRVSYYRQPANVGPQATFTTCIRRARGEWVHILHGDDMVAPGYYRSLEAASYHCPSIGAGLCRSIDVDADGTPVGCSVPELPEAGIHYNLIRRLAVENLIRFPAMAVKRRTYEQLGGFHPALVHSADWDMWKRIALAVPVWYDPNPLALYRVHEQSDTSHLMRTGANIADARQAIEIARRYLPAPDREDLTRQARLYHGLYAIEVAEEMILRRAWMAAWAQTREAFRCSCSIAVARATAGLALHTVPRLLAARRR
jgi:glycosyltransferase involved in cell wall biosynthesis